MKSGWTWVNYSEFLLLWERSPVSGDLTDATNVNLNHLLCPLQFAQFFQQPFWYDTNIMLNFISVPWIITSWPVFPILEMFPQISPPCHCKYRISFRFPCLFFHFFNQILNISLWFIYVELFLCFMLYCVCRVIPKH